MTILIILILILFFLLLINNLFLTEKFTQKEKLDVAVIVEPREHKYLIPVVLNFIENLPKETPIQIFHGTKNISFIKKGLNEYIESGKIRMTNLDRENLSIKDYNNLLTSKNFWNKIKGENILIFQTDTCLCSKNKHKIYDILKYDYVGGPWKSKTMPKLGGNGGLSFRKKSKMLQVCDKYKEGNEDKFYSSRNFFYPNKKIAQNIFVETIFSDNPFGVHKVWHWIKGDNFNLLKKNCPEINTIFGK